MLIFSVWPELVKLPNLHLIRPNTLFLLWACTSGRQREKRAMAPTPTPPPFPIPPHFVLCRDREATRRATARVCQAVTLAAPVVVKSAGSARPPTPPCSGHDSPLLRRQQGPTTAPLLPNPGRAARSSGGASFEQVYSSPIWYHFAGKIDLPCPSHVDLTLILRSSSTAQVKI